MRTLTLRRGAALVLALVGSTAVHVTAQQTSSPVVGGSPWLFGASVAREHLPGAVAVVCGGPNEGSMTVLSGRVGKRLGAVRVEASAGEHLEAVVLCPSAIWVPPDGINTIRAPGVGPGEFTTTDVRARYEAGCDGSFVMSAGAGWAWGGKDLPYLTSRVGFRAGSALRWGLEVQVDAYRVLWTTTTAMYSGGVVQSVLSTTTSRAWETAWSLGVVLEVSPGSQRR